jgi:hypothetical protein
MSKTWSGLIFCKNKNKQNYFGNLYYKHNNNNNNSNNNNNKITTSVPMECLCGKKTRVQVFQHAAAFLLFKQESCNETKLLFPSIPLKHTS